MIKANELRIGNCVLYLNELYLVDGIQYEPNAPESQWRIMFRTVDDNNQANTILRNGKMENWVDPIPLTPEILEKCGFEPADEAPGDGWYEAQIHYHTLQICLNTLYPMVIIKDEHDVDILFRKVTIFRYLHQLQNLYFALTGQELTLKETTIIPK